MVCWRSGAHAAINFTGCRTAIVLNHWPLMVSDTFRPCDRCGERAPELKILHLSIVFQSQPKFISGWIDNHRQSLGQDHVQRRIEIAKVLRPQ